MRLAFCVFRPFHELRRRFYSIAIGAENADTETSENTSKEKEPDLLKDHEEEADESCAETYNVSLCTVHV